MLWFAKSGRARLLMATRGLCWPAVWETLPPSFFAAKGRLGWPLSTHGLEAKHRSLKFGTGMSGRSRICSSYLGLAILPYHGCPHFRDYLGIESSINCRKCSRAQYLDAKQSQAETFRRAILEYAYRCMVASHRMRRCSSMYMRDISPDSESRW